jgi:hypothetical protein
MEKTIEINGTQYELTSDKVRRIVEGIQETEKQIERISKTLPYFEGSAKSEDYKSQLAQYKAHKQKLIDWLA